MKKKKTLRKCISCDEQKNKFDLIRVVRTKDRNIIVDETGKASGRGAYICKNEKCINSSLEENLLSKSLKCKVNLSDIKEDLYKSLD